MRKMIKMLARRTEQSREREKERKRAREKERKIVLFAEERNVPRTERHTSGHSGRLRDSRCRILRTPPCPPPPRETHSRTNVGSIGVAAQIPRKRLDSNSGSAQGQKAKEEKGHRGECRAGDPSIARPEHAAFVRGDGDDGSFSTDLHSAPGHTKNGLSLSTKLFR